MTNEIKVIAKLILDLNYYEQVLNELKHLAKMSKIESGNLLYKVYKDISAQNSIILIEHWKSIEAFEKHKETYHFKSYKTNTKHMILSDEVLILENID
jgi:quinol monooxygenase YgiN